jgi:hypothetical protein
MSCFRPQSFGTSGPTQINRNHLRLYAMFATELLRQCAKLLFASGGEHQVHTFGRQRPRECFPDPAGRSRHQRPAGALDHGLVHSHRMVVGCRLVSVMKSPGVVVIAIRAS